MDTTVETRVCSSCGIEQPLDNYYPHQKAPDGRMASCKKCRKAWQRVYQSTRQKELRILHNDAFYEAAINNPDLLKRCYRCKEEKHVGAFGRHATRYDGFKCACKSCARAMGKERGRTSTSTQNRKRRLANYGLTLDQYKMLLDSQGGVCAICAEPPSSKENLAVDHCHKGGHVRGLLCRSCNTALGLMKDDARIANRAVEYLLRF